jgi:dimethylamine--corrinoid protein Co-methyltransferase
MQLKGMRLAEAKQYVADKLGVSAFDLSNSTLMRRLREELDIGVVSAVAGAAKGLEAKARIADLLGVRINCVERLKKKMGV